MPNSPDVARRATSYDVARMAGVAQSTVSRCFQSDSNISPATRERVLAAADRLGYMPNALARSLITQRSDLVCVVAARYTMRSSPDVIYALGESLASAGKQLMLITVPHDFPSRETLRRGIEYPLDGLISCVLFTDEQFAELRRRDIPLVLFNRISERNQVDSVATNHEFAAAEIATMLHAAGHRRFLCVGGPPDAPVSRQRTTGFLRRLASLGVPHTPLLETDYSYAGGRDAFLAHVRNAARPEAVFCANDQIALGVMDACRHDRSWAIPDDISVIGFDDVAEAGRPGNELTTMHQDSVEMANQAVQLLLARLHNRNAPVANAVIPARFMRRRSARLGP
jgi:DNA-binding LacI/PurR family transcriptional regulator